MAKRYQEVMQRRRVLLDKISGQREQLAGLETRFQPALLAADQLWRVVVFLRGHVLLTAGLAGIVLLRRRGVTGVLKGGWRAWKAYRYFNELSRKYMR
jgi:hypothetical protein